LVTCFGSLKQQDHFSAVYWGRSGSRGRSGSIKLEQFLLDAIAKHLEDTMSREKMGLVKAFNREASYIDQSNELSKAVLRELFELLEDYGPLWYTERHHNKAAAALQECPPNEAAQR
jgi:hypothetical protein